MTGRTPPSLRQGARVCALLAAIVVFVSAPLSATGPAAAAEAFLRISDWRTGEVYVKVPARIGGELFFGWIHSLEKIPWNEYFHIGEDGALILDAITFPAFGAGIPENKGRVCYVKDGLIHMEEIDQRFEELVWLNSHTATREIRLDGAYVTKGSELPHHARLRLAVERSDAGESK
jgi:hypothetical protein